MMQKKKGKERKEKGDGRPRPSSKKKNQTFFPLTAFLQYVSAAPLRAPEINKDNNSGTSTGLKPQEGTTCPTGHDDDDDDDDDVFVFSTSSTQY
jgi:hypothetical protein